MHFLNLTFLYCMLIISSAPTMEYPSASSTKTIKSTSNNNDVELGATKILQSKNGGKTWQDISLGLPENAQPEGFFAGESEVYIRINKEMYRSKSDLITPVWEKEVLDPRSTSIAFNRSGVMAYNYNGQVYQKMSTAGKWIPIYTNFKKHSMRTIFETSYGTIFFGYDHGLYKSNDKGQSWKQVQREGWVMDIVESEGVLMATGQKGIMRSIDKGENWEWVISEGGVGIAIEPIKGGFAAITYNTTTNSRRIRISMDGGKTWKAIDDRLAPSSSISSIKLMGDYLICGHPDGIFRSADMGKTWNKVHSSVDENELKFAKTNWKIIDTNSINKEFKLGKALNSVDFNNNRKVFKIYTSGSTLYAVATNAGC